jgi:hypothetical protein
LIAVNPMWPKDSYLKMGNLMSWRFCAKPNRFQRTGRYILHAQGPLKGKGARVNQK